MNLENLGVQEMNAKELTTVDGGIIPLLVLGAMAVDAAILGTMAGYLYTMYTDHNH
ncbi:MAG: class IIb bacteriocin, lactobin A/cerein 7B family [Winogradskyella sp.]|uniref:class IIb bacteriocin, lactobin A/cerein 7B family n=1 Tax=Winogradskyella sp. TaxID=1883156 RepID=UPI0017B1E23C|nr:class IIb bacteriocin, lactobin A/cerein 7B family [Winogradskyella sp.]MBT8245773.1 class IIb bacteriocin, lactobin A/cerein 7B family [Winogradskyella sp.]NNK23343.1 class IIb bacteriocin, lactobin A/cerein 7B family [Winogradskyella sp.]